ncbi:hypothetical protein BJP36_39025 [Moorena producens JHB]|uniref:Uncharacterized protein n=1 Tax=Moorena producens (strain JHB) TaxID=1454205 RepID=A0A9Q9SUU9_MOOP1|nr:hypothetical protein [Moorena producens]WAN70059.1 hypothetical protein BJP36_39025 [Moorena producens JHB]
MMKLSNIHYLPTLPYLGLSAIGLRPRYAIADLVECDWPTATLRDRTLVVGWANRHEQALLLV